VRGARVGQVAQRVRQLLGRESQLFADGERGSVVVKTKGDQLHADERRNLSGRGHFTRRCAADHD
jgi:hypothetical protein